MFKKTLLYLGLLASLAAHAAGLPVKIGVDAEFGHKTSTSAQAVEQGIQIAIDEINPVRSLLHATNANGGSGGRIQSVAADPQDGKVYYAASEWGGLYKTVDRGRNWERLDNFLATAAWRVAVQPGNSQVLVATALFDGRVDSRAGILRSTDGGLSWTRPASVTPPAGACADNRAVRELSGFGVAFDPAHPERVYAATNCGLAISTDGGQNWRYVNPMGAGGARRLVDVIVHGGGIDVCGDIGHRRSTDGGTTWSGPSATGNPLPGGGFVARIGESRACGRPYSAMTSALLAAKVVRNCDGDIPLSLRKCRLKFDRFENPTS